MINEEYNVYQDWLEFKCDDLGEEEELTFVNLKRSEISEVVQCTDTDKWTRIFMKNGNEYLVHMQYNKVMEIV